MITFEQVQNYTNKKFNEQDGSDRIKDSGFAYYIDTQPREYLDTKDIKKMSFGNGPIVILKETGDIFSFSSNPSHEFGDADSKIGVNSAKTIEEFNHALSILKDKGDSSALNPENFNLE